MNAPTLRIFLQLFAPFAAAIVVAALLVTIAQEDSARGRLEASESLNVGLGNGMLDRRLQVVINDLRTLAGGSAMRRLSEHADDAGLDALAEDFTALMTASGAYDRIRLLGTDGRERLRVRLRDGKPERIADTGLQDGSRRDDYIAAATLSAGGVHISRIDLEMDSDAIGQPARPLLRAAVPVTDADGRRSGILVLDYLAAEMFGYVRDVTTPIADRLAIVDGDGYFLLSADPQQEWGFMPGRGDVSLARLHPAAWQRILAEEHGQFEDDDGLWTFETRHPLRILGTPIELGTIDAYRWVVVSHLAPEALAALSRTDRGLRLLLVGALLVTAAALCWTMARTRARQRELEARYRVFFERSLVGMAVVGTDRRWRVVNPALCNILGYSEDALMTRSWADITHPEDLSSSDAAYARIARGEVDGYELQKRYLRGDGRAIDVLVAVRAIRDAGGSPDYYLAMIEDISARVAAEKALRESEERIRLVSDNLPDSYIFQATLNEDGAPNFAYISSGLERIQGISPAEAIAHPERMLENVDPAQVQELIMRQLESAQSFDDFCMELRIRRASGEWGWLKVHSRPRRLPNGALLWDGIATDITAQRRAAALAELQGRRSSALLELPRLVRTMPERAFMQHALDLIEALTASEIAFMHFVDHDAETIELVAWSTRTLRDGYCTAAYDNHYPLSRAGIWADAARQRRPVVFNDYASASGRHGLPEGHAPLRRLISCPVLDQGQVRLMTGVGNKAEDYSSDDVETIELIANETWRLVHQARSDRALRIATQVVNASPVVCFRWRAEAGWPVEYVSENVSLWGYSVESLLAGDPPFSAMVHPDDLTRVADEVARYTAEGRASYDQEYRLLKANGEAIWVTDRTIVQRDDSGAPRYYDGIISDISERKAQEQAMAANLDAQRSLNKRLEEAHNQLLQSEKMASIGQLAAGVAHELNNPIGFVHSNLGTLDNYLAELMGILDAFENAARAGETPTQILETVARLKQACDFDFIREDMGPLMHESRDGLMRVRKIVQDLKSFSHVSEQEWGWADLHAGLDTTLNIVRNELKYKCNIVKTYGDIPEVHCIISQLNQVFMNLLVNAGQAIESQGTVTIRTARCGDDEVMVEISDTGKGIAPEHLTRIFDPFFTTKPVGSGTGLGLSLSYGIVQRHHGRIEVESAPGHGACFRVILPINAAIEATGTATPAAMDTTSVGATHTDTTSTASS